MSYAIWCGAVLAAMCILLVAGWTGPAAAHHHGDPTIKYLELFSDCAKLKDRDVVDWSLLKIECSLQEGPFYLPGVNLTGSEILNSSPLSAADWSHVILDGAILVRAHFEDGIDMRNASMRDADMNRVYLIGADLSNADLSNADLSNADLSNADLSNADLSNATLGTARLEGAILTNARLLHADLVGADLQGADLRGAYMCEGGLEGTLNANGTGVVWVECLPVQGIAGPINPTPVSAVFDGSEGFSALDGANDVDVFGQGGRTYAIVTTEDDGVQIMDITNPIRPIPVSAVSDGSGGLGELYGANDVEVFSQWGRTYAIVTTLGDDGVQIMDITNPIRPVTVSTAFDSSGRFNALYGAGSVEVFSHGGRTHAIVTTLGDDGVQIMDIANPIRPVPVSGVFDGSGGFSELDGANDVEVFGQGDRTYAIATALGDDGVQIMDITDPTRPVPVSAVSDGSGGFSALDGANDVEVYGQGGRTYAIVAAQYDDGVQIINITNLTRPVPVSAVFDGSGGFGELDGAGSVEVFGQGGRTYAVVAAQYDDGVQIMNITDPTRPVPVSAVFDGSGEFSALDGANDVEVFGQGDRTYAIATAWHDDGVQIMNITDPTRPVTVSTVSDGSGGFSTLYGAGSVEVFGQGDRTYAIVAALHDDGVQIMNIDNPTRPVPVSAVSDGSGGFGELDGANDVEVFGQGGRTYAIVAAQYDDGVQIMNIDNPTRPVPVSAVSDNTGGFGELDGANDVEVFNQGGRTYAIVAALHDDGVQIMNIINSTRPVPVSAVSDDTGGFGKLDGANDVEVFSQGNRTYAIVAALHDDGVQIMDITNSTRPVPVSAVSDDTGGFSALDGAGSVEVFSQGNRTYAIVAAWHDDGVQIMNITNSTHPAPVSAVFDGSGGFGELDGANDVEVFSQGNRTYAIVAALHDDGVQIMDITNPTRPVPVSAVSDGSGGFSALYGAGSVKVFSQGDRMYAIVAASYDDGVQIMDITGK